MKIISSVLVLFGLSTFIFSSQTRLDFVNNLAQVAGILPEPTASLLINGQPGGTFNVGQPVTYSWSSTNADTATSSYTDTCHPELGVIPWNKSTLSGSNTTPPLPVKLANCSYVLNYKVTQTSTGKTAESSINMSVVPAENTVSCKPATPPTGCTLTGTASNVKSQYCGMTLSCSSTTVTAKPTITSLTPSAAPTNTEIVITGTGFTPTGNIVFVGKGQYESTIVPSIDGAHLRIKIVNQKNPTCEGCVYAVNRGESSVFVKNANGVSKTIIFTLIDPNEDTTVAEAKSVMDSIPDNDFLDIQSTDFFEWSETIPYDTSLDTPLASVSNVLAVVFTQKQPGGQSIESHSNTLSKSNYDISITSPYKEVLDDDACAVKDSNSVTLKTKNLHDSNGVLAPGASANFGPFDDDVTVTFNGSTNGEFLVDGKPSGGNINSKCTDFVKSVQYGPVIIPKGKSVPSFGVRRNYGGPARLDGTLTIKNTWLKNSVQKLLNSVMTDKFENAYSIISYPYGVKKMYIGTKGTNGSVSFFKLKKIYDDSALYGGTNFIIAMVHNHPPQVNPIIGTLTKVMGMPPSVNGVKKDASSLDVTTTADYDSNYVIQNSFKPLIIQTYVVDSAQNIWWYGVPSLASLQKAYSIIENMATQTGGGSILTNGFLDPVKMMKKIHIPAGLPLGKTKLSKF